MAVQGVVLCDHIRSIDWRARGASFAAVAPPAVLNTVVSGVFRIVT
jgi:mRNA-degrading endonuclease toxin of MazEF toxin-antitoxin module